MEITEILSQFLTVVDLFGVVLGGILGGMVAREERFDIVGFVALAVMAALGGGMVRDVLLDGPAVALTNPFYLIGACLGALIAFLLPLRGRWWNRFFVVTDALVVGAWSATGAVKTLSFGFGVGPAILLGVLTGVGGGMIRDIAVGRRPAIFGGNTLYATGAIAATIPAVGLWYLHQPVLALLAGMVVGGGLCIAARYFKWVLPVNNDYSIARHVRERRNRARTTSGGYRRPAVRITLRKNVRRK